ncbi:uncharacterized protein LOC110833496 isoform X2 [Zootermopsis nevadensis]|uniref:Activating molecule in BECN1-regulated autophagy protein 1 n=2 Tax=Zootermopsis nevadensis TaxID=136037 RepID=A0A067QYL2_ZOONE|nr:uncharacterized protein LOC110833496 isoform X2 [Zootermopsis nevadensis]XP_021927321.1 uncharacterized protein LOC110833496 isoform X2 [Zootermopsis nevadensis]XP_021927322.1 uncharacterized protein LOC110833496 isoform X2 [Zootermopsis nevadensis]XP_021927323.1 uncharacterized protein LOC110833496 isoform X2 [Zootermopsis nevadensis]KDR15571.1 Activating molecule in BECN1-regulated autophagy protein 1 [Zootermopsis nevadensis]
MDERSSKAPDIVKSLPKTNRSVPRGLLHREVGFKEKQGRVSTEFQLAAEDQLVLKNHEELFCELPDVSRSTFLMVFSPDGTKVASTHGNHNVYVTDLNTGKNVNTLSGHPRTPWCIAFHPSSNQILASGCLGGQVRVWDLHGGSEIWTAESQTVIASLAFHPTDRMLVIATYNELHFWDWSQPIPFTKCYTSNEKEKVRYVAFDPLGHKLITGISNAPHNHTQWDRVAAPPRPGSSLASTSHDSHPHSVVVPPEQDRRITVCYRSLVEQYEQLVQRYYDLSRARTPTMDRGTDPMDLSESLPPGLRSGAQSQSQTERGTSRFVIHDSSIGAASAGGSTTTTTTTTITDTTSGSNDNGSRPGASDGPSAETRNVSQRTAQNLNAMESVLKREDVLSRSGAECHDVAKSASSVTGHGPPQEFGEQTAVPSSSATDTERIRNLSEQQLISPDSVTGPADNQSRVQMTSGPSPTRPVLSTYTSDTCSRRYHQNQDAAAQPLVTESSLSSEQHDVSSRLHSEAPPSSPCPPERPRRFFVSQRSAFKPRIPRGSQQTNSESRLGSRLPSGNQTPRRGFFLQRRLSGACHSQSFQDGNGECPPSRGLDSTSDVGVRYGIQLLSTHIDNMQRLCRARLEILQLQHIRRMWEDLQQQIRSLHVAVRESTFAMRDSQDRSRRRFRLYSHPNDNSGLSSDSQFILNTWRERQLGPGATEQGPHIPSMSQMLEELARISDVSPPSSVSQTPASSGGGSAVCENPVTASDQPPSNQGTLTRLHAKFVALTRLKFMMNKRDGARKEGETSKNNAAVTSRNIVTTTSKDTAQPVNTPATESKKFKASDGVLTVSQSAKSVTSDDHRSSAEGPSFQPDSAESAVSSRTSDSICRQDIIKIENVTNSPGISSVTDGCGDTGSPCNKKQGEEMSSSSRSVHSDSSIPVQDTCSGGNSSAPIVPTITTATTVASSSAMDPDTMQHESSGHQPSSSWCRHPSDSSAAAPSSTSITGNTTPLANSAASSIASSHFQRLLRVSRRVYLRRPRLLALGPRSRTVARQLSSSGAVSHKNSTTIFRQHESGRRPWFMQSALRTQQLRTSVQGVRSSAQVETTQSCSPEEGGSNGSGSGSFEQANSSPVDASSQSTVSPQMSPPDEAFLQSANRPGLDTSSQSDVQPGPSRWLSVSHGTSSQETPACGAGTSKDRPSATPLGTKRKADNRAGPSTGAVCPDGSEQKRCSSQHERTTSESLRAMIARLEALVRQQREQRESVHRESFAGRGRQQMNVWELRDRHLWFRADANSGSDSDSNPESERRQSWRRLSAEERLIMALENETNSSSTFGSRRRGSSGPLDEDWEWTRVTTRLRARQVLSLMVESLTQFFEENGLSNNTSRAVLDEQIYNLYILLQLALELTDLLLAQLLTTRRELEHQWAHRLRSPVALDAATAAGQQQSRRGSGRLPSRDDEQETRRLGQPYARPLSEQPDSLRMSAYGRQLRYRHHPLNESDVTEQLDNVPGTSVGTGVNRGESTRRLGPRIINCYSRHGSHTGIPASARICRGSSRLLVRGAVPRRDSIGVHLLSYSRDDGIHISPHTQSAGIHSPSYSSREAGRNSLNYEEPAATNSPEIRSPPRIVVRVENNVPFILMPASACQQNHDRQPQQEPQQHPQQPHQHQHQQQQQQQLDAFTVPLVQVNDVLIPDTSILNQSQSRQRPQSPPPHPPPNLRSPFIQQAQSPLRYLGDTWRYPVSPGEASWRSGWRPRFLHPRYVAPHPFSDDQDEPLIGPTLENINIIRDSFIITDAPMSPNHRIQAWDFSRLSIPDISNAEKNVIVAECKIHNDASVDVSNDGHLLVTLLPTGRLSSTAMLGVYSLEWESLGQCLYTTSFEQNAVSVSLSPASRHLLVGLASRRVALLPADRQTMAQIFRLEGGVPGRAVGARGRLCHVRDIDQDREQGYMSLNCIRWAPGPGQGLVYGTNTGKLKVLR